MPAPDATADTQIDVPLSHEDIAEAHALAEASLARFANTRGHYRNTANSHLIGRYGEIATDKWLRVHVAEVESLFRDPDRERECDVTADGLRVEVKTWNAAYWDRWGRCVAVGQFEKLRSKADVIAWCTVAVDGTGPLRVSLRGWNRIEDLLTLEPVWTGPKGKQVRNLQMPHDQLRPMARFPGAI